MSVRKPNLEEWFLIYQLKKAKRNHFHIPLTLDADVTRIYEIFTSRGERVPWTSILVKAAAVLARNYAPINRIVFSTLFGVRFVEPDYIAVNVPVTLRINGKTHLAAHSVRDADQKSLSLIHEEIKKSANRKLSETKLGPVLYAKKNTFLNRQRMKFIYFLMNNFPGLYQKFSAGGISVSSLLNVHDGRSKIRIQAYGQTALTLAASSVVIENGKAILSLGISYDHYACYGEEAVKAINLLANILRGDDETAFKSLLS